MNTNPPTPVTDSAVAQRIQEEWDKVRAALQGQSLSEVQDPLGNDGLLSVKMSFFKANGGGEVLLCKGSAPGDRRYTRFRAFGPTGLDTIEKTSYLIKADGTTVFHKRRVEAPDTVTVLDLIDAEDEAWSQSLT